MNILLGLAVLGMFLFGLHRRQAKKCGCHGPKAQRDKHPNADDPNASDNYFDGFVDGRGY